MSELTPQVRLQAVGSTVHFDAAGFPGWTVVLKEQPASLRPRGSDWAELFRSWRRFSISITPH